MIDLFYSANSGVYKGVFMSSLSIAETTKEPLNIRILTGDFSKIDKAFLPIFPSEENLLRTALLSKNPENRLTVIDVTPIFWERLGHSPNLRSFFTPYSMFRLLLDEIAGIPPKILFLDADTVAMKDVSTLFSIDVEGYEMAAVPDAIGKHFFGRHYCNVGVLLMNVTQMVEDGVFAKAIKLMNTHRYPFPDQDVLNKVTKGRRLHLPREFNEQKKIRPETVIRHYCNKPVIFPYPHALIAKPWEIDRIHEIHHTTAHDALYKECDSYWGRLKK